VSEGPPWPSIIGKGLLSPFGGGPKRKGKKSVNQKRKRRGEKRPNLLPALKTREKKPRITLRGGGGGVPASRRMKKRKKNNLIIIKSFAKREKNLDS